MTLIQPTHPLDIRCQKSADYLDAQTAASESALSLQCLGAGGSESNHMPETLRFLDGALFDPVHIQGFIDTVTSEASRITKGTGSTEGRAAQRSYHWKLFEVPETLLLMLAITLNDKESRK